MLEVDHTVVTIKENLRDIAARRRHNNRDSVWGRNRIISDAVFEGILPTEEVKLLCEKLKNKRSKVSREDLCALKQALFQDYNNISLFFSVNGALYSLVRELSGSEAMHQLEAVCCCCNLALGDAKCNLRLTKAAAPYIVARLDGLSAVTVDVCVWAVGNLASGGTASWQILHSQGVLDKLLHLRRSSDEKLMSTLMYTLTHYVRTGLDILLPEELVNIATQAHHLVELYPASYWLMFILSYPSASADVLIDNHIVSRCCQLLTDLVQGDDGIDQRLSRVTALVRVLGNLVTRTDGMAAMELLSSQVMGALKLLLKCSYPHVKKECTWLLANVWGHPCDTVRHVCCAYQDIEHELLSTFISTEHS